MNKPIPLIAYNKLRDAFRATFGCSAENKELLDMYAAAGSDLELVLEGLRGAWTAIHNEKKTVTVKMLTDKLRAVRKNRAARVLNSLPGMGPQETQKARSQAAINILTEGRK